MAQLLRNLTFCLDSFCLVYTSPHAPPQSLLPELNTHLTHCLGDRLLLSLRTSGDMFSMNLKPVHLELG